MCYEVPSGLCKASPRCWGRGGTAGDLAVPEPSLSAPSTEPQSESGGFSMDKGSWGPEMTPEPEESASTLPGHEGPYRTSSQFFPRLADK